MLLPEEECDNLGVAASDRWGGAEMAFAIAVWTVLTGDDGGFRCKVMMAAFAGAGD